MIGFGRNSAGKGRNLAGKGWNSAGKGWNWAGDFFHMMYMRKKKQPIHHMKWFSSLVMFS